MCISSDVSVDGNNKDIEYWNRIRLFYDYHVCTVSNQLGMSYDNEIRRKDSLN